MRHINRTPVAAGLALLALAFAPWTGGTAAAEMPKQELVYRLAFGEVMLGEAKIRLQNSGATYRVAMDSHSHGPLDNVLTWTSQAESSGRAIGGRFLPESHLRRSTWRGDERFMRVRYFGGNKVDVEAQPPENKSKTKRILAKLSQAPIDPYSAALALIHNVDANGRCQDTADVFDGRKLYKIEMRDTGMSQLRRDRPWAYAGEARRCTLITQRVDKERDARDRGDEADDHRHDIFVWFGRVTPTSWAPVRIELPLPVGRLTARFVAVNN